MNKSKIIRKRCSALYMKMRDPSLCCDRIASLCGCHRNSVRNWILQYNREGISALLSTHPYHRSGELASHASVILSSLDSSPVHSVKEACARIKEVCSVDRTPDIPIAVVMDNARYQHCKAVMDKAKKLGIELLFLPPYSPNLNVIERLWKFYQEIRPVWAVLRQACEVPSSHQRFSKRNKPKASK